MVPLNWEEKVFCDPAKPITYDEFNTYSLKLEEWVEMPANQTSKAYEALRDAYDLKKLNTGLSKTNVIEDLIADAYSLLYEKLVPDIIKRLAGNLPTAQSSANPMALHNLM